MRYPSFSERDIRFMRLALRLAKRGYGSTSPNPMVGAVLVKDGQALGMGWHHRAGEPHAEVEAIRNAAAKGHRVSGSTLYVTLEPCSTFGRTTPCTEAIQTAGIRRVIVAATDPNPAHAGRGFQLLRKAGIEVVQGLLTDEATALNETFNHWIVHRTPFVTVKAAMTIDGKIASSEGESKWISGEKALAWRMKLRAGVDAILVGINTILADDPSLTIRPLPMPGAFSSVHSRQPKLRRIILDTQARTPLRAKIVSDEFTALTTIVVANAAPKKRVAALARQVRVLAAPQRKGKIHLPGLLRKLGAEQITHLLVEGGGEVNASFLLQRLAHRVAFIYAPRILTGRDAPKAVGGQGLKGNNIIKLTDVQWRWLDDDLLLTAGLAPSAQQ